jgi:TRAP-type mannitol/chloroaromatic compound transport system substrate-binding protein
VSIPAACARRQIPFTVKFHRKGLLPTCGCFPDVSKICMLQSYHQNTEQFEILFNKTKYDALPEKMKVIIANAVDAASADMCCGACSSLSICWRHPCRHQFCLKGVSPPHATRSSPA